MAATLERDILHEAGIGSFFRPSQLKALGVPYHRIRRLEASGELERVGWGLYRIADAEITENHSVAAVCARVPSAIVCLLSALRIHDIGSQLPRHVWIGIEHKAKPPALSGEGVRLVRFSGAAWTHGIEETTFEGVPARITDPARTIVDCFRFQRLIGYEAALEALKDALQDRKVTTDALERTLRVLPSRRLSMILETGVL